MKTLYALFGVLFLLYCTLPPCAAQTQDRVRQNARETPRLEGGHRSDDKSDSRQRSPSVEPLFQSLPDEIAQPLSRAQALGSSQPEQSRILAEKALRLAKRHKYPAAEYSAYQLLGEGYEKGNNPARASAHYSMQIRTAMRIGRPDLIVAAQINLARTLSQRHLYDSARTVIADATRRAERAGLPSRDMESDMLRGNIYFQLGEYALAAPCYDAAAKAYLGTGDSSECYKALMGAAKARNLSEQYEEALWDYTQCLTFHSPMKDSTESIRLYNNIAGVYNKLGKYDSSVTNFQTAINLAKELGKPYLIAVARMGLGVALYNLEYNDRAVEEYIEALTLAKHVRDDQKREILKAFIYMNLGAAFSRLREYDKSMQYYLREEEIREKLGDTGNLPITYYSIAEMLVNKEDYAAAETYYEKARQLSQQLNNHESAGIILGGMSRLALRRGRNRRALEYALRSLALIRPTGAKLLIAMLHDDLGTVYDSLGRYETAKQHFIEEMRIGKNIRSKRVLSQAAHGLAHTFERMGRYDSAFYYSDMHTHIRDSILTDNMAMQAKATEAMFQADKHARETEVTKLKLLHSEESNARRKFMNYAGTIAFVLVFVGAVVAFAGYWGRKKAHERLQATQEQLLVQEKLASLGQLTAGIAHEIQNPLNFVNNFSEMTRELAEEAEQSILRNNALTNEEKLAELNKLVSDMKENSFRVTEHGKRASSIVNQMLQHARTDSSETTDLDLNKILTEMADLAYHGMRARHKGMSIEIVRDLSPEPLVIHAGAQEIGRVVVNILNNAFDAVIERIEHDDGYHPCIQITTRRNGNCTELHIRDNGPGIPENIRAKIFQPFYTTKPSGKGTGLGLSLSHDIITKKYGGTLRVHSKPGTFTEFVVSLPLKKI